MKLYDLARLSGPEYKELLQRAEADIRAHAGLADEVIRRVQKEGDKAVLDYTLQFDGVSLKAADLRVPAEELAAAYRQLDSETREVLEYAAANIKKFHRQQLPQEMWLQEIDQGLLAGEKVTPISDVCLYVPRGKGSFPSVMLMLGVPAAIAQVPRIVVCTPPGEGGQIETATLAAAHIAGVRELYRVGGMQAIAAVAFGTETIPRCRKVIGPGNAYVNAAKRQLYGVLDVGLPAGPSEAIILADETTKPRLAALDLMIEAEHGPDSAALLVTHERELAQKVAAIVPALLPKLPAERRSYIETVLNNYGGIVLTASLEESIRFVNDYAPEHLEVLTAEPLALLPQIKNAGEIMLGFHTPMTLSNFILGPNAVLPTGSFALTYSGVSVHDFLKRSAFGYVTPAGFQKVKDTAARFAELEGFWAHAQAVRERE
ncbi:MAG: histidinol dehydrogenase [Firmicutes bacterium]|nr:histidinol dehydrogenase [Bacillota bacterium]